MTERPWLLRDAKARVVAGAPRPHATSATWAVASLLAVTYVAMMTPAEAAARSTSVMDRARLEESNRACDEALAAYFWEPLG